MDPRLASSRKRQKGNPPNQMDIFDAFAKQRQKNARKHEETDATVLGSVNID